MSKTRYLSLSGRFEPGDYLTFSLNNTNFNYEVQEADVSTDDTATLRSIAVKLYRLIDNSAESANIQATTEESRVKLVSNLDFSLDGSASNRAAQSQITDINFGYTGPIWYGTTLTITVNDQSVSHTVSRINISSQNSNNEIQASALADLINTDPVLSQVVSASYGVIPGTVTIYIRMTAKQSGTPFTASLTGVDNYASIFQPNVSPGIDYTQELSILSQINQGQSNFSISGAANIAVPVVDEILTAVKVSDDPDGNGNSGFTYAWETSTDGISWNVIADSTASSYKITSAEEGKQIRLIVTYTDAQNFSETVIVNSGSVSAKAPTPTPITSPTPTPTTSPTITPELNPILFPSPEVTVTTDNIASLAPDEISTLTSDDLRLIESDVIKDFTAGQLLDLAPDALQGFSKEHVSELKPDAIEVLTPEQLSSLTPTAFKGFSRSQVSAMRPDVIQDFEPEQLISLQPAAFKGFSSDQISSVKPEAFSSFTGKILKKIRPSAISGLLAEQVELIEGELFGSLKPKQLQKMTTEAFKGVDAIQLNSLGERQLKKIDEDKISALNPSMIDNIDVEIFSLLQADAITGFTKKQAKKLAADQLNALKKNQIQALNENAIPGLKKKVLQEVEADTFKYFSADQLDAFKFKQLKSIDTEILESLSGKQKDAISGISERLLE